MQKIAILYDASQAVLSTFDLDEVLQRILLIARDYFHLQNVAILLLDKDNKQLCMRSQIGGEPGLDDVRVQHRDRADRDGRQGQASPLRPRFQQRVALCALGEEDAFRAGNSA